MDKVFKIFEYDKLTIGVKDDPSTKKISQKTYDLLNTFYKENKKREVDCIFEKIHNGIYVSNYVGTIFLSNHVRIEILPKIYRKSNIEDKTKEATDLIIKMLEVCRRIKPKNISGRTNLTKFSSIFEIYIALFCQEVNQLIKRGLKSSYINIEENATRFTGKILFQKHLTTNFIHKERVYVSRDIFDVNRPENMLIKSALLKIKRLTNDNDNKKSINTLLSYLDEVEASTSIDEDFAKCYRNANNKEYEYALIYAKLFLKNQGFNIYDTNKNNYAFLLPMNELFEEYVYRKLVEFYGNEKGIEIKFQSKPKYLFDDPKFIQLNPDIMVTYNNKTIIYDTKWKIIKEKDSGLVHDLYQMYVYHKRIDNTTKVVLLYPYVEGDSKDDPYKTDNGEATITIRKIKLPIDTESDFTTKIGSDLEEIK